MAPDDPLPVPPLHARAGVPVLLAHPGGEKFVDVLEARFEIPTVERFDWSIADHVVGCGTRVTHEILDAVGVPRVKQHITEVHNRVPFIPDRTFPRLRGRVVVVDDAHEGETSLALARLHRATVVSVAPGLTLSDYFLMPHPVAVIDSTALARAWTGRDVERDERIRWEVGELFDEASRLAEAS